LFPVLIAFLNLLFRVVEDIFDTTINSLATSFEEDQFDSARRKRRKAQGKFTDYFDQEKRTDGTYFICKLNKTDETPCRKTYKGPANSIQCKFLIKLF
jgi:hypothetical protein